VKMKAVALLITTSVIAVLTQGNSFSSEIRSHEFDEKAIEVPVSPMDLKELKKIKKELESDLKIMENELKRRTVQA